MYNSRAEPAHVRISRDRPIAEAFAVDLLEERQTALTIENDSVAFVLKRKQIQTVELVS